MTSVLYCMLYFLQLLSGSLPHCWTWGQTLAWAGSRQGQRKELSPIPGSQGPGVHPQIFVWAVQCLSSPTGHRSLQGQEFSDWALCLRSPKMKKRNYFTPLKHGCLIKFVAFYKDLFPSFSCNMIVVSMIEHVLRACSRWDRPPVRSSETILHSYLMFFIFCLSTFSLDHLPH